MQMIDISVKHNANYLINNKLIDVSSSLFSNYGIYTGFELFKEERIAIIPEVRLLDMVVLKQSQRYQMRMPQMIYLLK
jgi:hypothetical protein